ncbi:MAG TPA: pentapeptide repeat-containing protein [Bacteroidia bacterium]|jgi:fluoroquinolone resistance protein|nr:pentapeptide repeat-containing protein [Bacteroidia bacterium]
MSLSIKRGQDQADKDFSGLDFVNQNFQDIDFHESVFNGVHFKKVKFLNCNLKHAEFTEAKFTDCSFINCELNYSDFVYTQVSKVTFEKCSFPHVEWRENNFKYISFVECSFYNSTISLCSFANTKFDKNSSLNFCGASKRYNVFSNSNFSIAEEKIEFLKNNYGIKLEKKETQFYLNKEYKNEFLLNLSAIEYANLTTTKEFIDLILKALEFIIIKRDQKNRIQKMKYLSLICKYTIEGNNLSVFAQQFLINSFNALSKKIKETEIFMELASLMMFIKTNLYKLINLISSEINEEELCPYKTTIRFYLNNEYSKKEMESYLITMAGFIELDRRDFKIINYHKGSTAIEIFIETTFKISAVLVFISFSLSKVSKSLKHVIEIRKSLKKLSAKKKKKNSDVTLMPLSIMANKSNKYYTQINNVVNNYAKEVIKIDGEGKVDILIDNSSRKQA